jgi:phenylacetate-CoA ligase
MKHIHEKMHYKSPVWMQNIFISLYGAKLKRRRYAGQHDGYLKWLQTTEQISPGEIIELQTQEFLRIVGHAFEHVPFYRRFSRESGFSAADFKSLDDIGRLPIIDKETIRKDPLRFCAQNYLSQNNFILYTSGTTGKPLSIFCDPDSRQKHYAFWSYLRERNGVAKGMKRATLFGRVICLPDTRVPPFWRYDAANKNLLMSSYHLAEQNLESYCAKLEHFEPVEIIGYPSSILRLAKHLKKYSNNSIRPRVVFTTAETLLVNHRAVIEDAFQTSLIDQYGSTEMVNFAAQCRHGRYHLFPQHGYLEVVDDNDHPVAPGHMGEAVCTGFVNMTMPLMRYRLGDVVQLSTQPCTCGSCYPVLDGIVGRMDDILMMAEGQPIGRLDPIFKGRTNIYETQIVQNDLFHLLIRMVVDESFTQEDEDNLKYELHKRVGEGIDITILKVNEIPKDKNGKFKSVISNVKPVNR